MRNTISDRSRSTLNEHKPSNSSKIPSAPLSLSHQVHYWAVVVVVGEGWGGGGVWSNMWLMLLVVSCRAALRLCRGLTLPLSRWPPSSLPSPPLTCTITLGKSCRQVAHTPALSLANLYMGTAPLSGLFSSPWEKSRGQPREHKWLLVCRHGNQMWGDGYHGFL